MNVVPARRWARSGASRETILAALGLTEERLRDEAALAQALEAEISRGRALAELDAIAGKAAGTCPTCRRPLTPTSEEVRS